MAAETVKEKMKEDLRFGEIQMLNIRDSEEPLAACWEVKWSHHHCGEVEHTEGINGFMLAMVSTESWWEVCGHRAVGGSILHDSKEDSTTCTFPNAESLFMVVLIKRWKKQILLL